jgi:hypothetical protein
MPQGIIVQQDTGVSDQPLIAPDLMPVDQRHCQFFQQATAEGAPVIRLNSAIATMSGHRHYTYSSW